MLIFKKELCSKDQGGCENCTCRLPGNDWCNDIHGCVVKYNDDNNAYECDVYEVVKDWCEEIEDIGEDN